MQSYQNIPSATMKEEVLSLMRKIEAHGAIKSDEQFLFQELNQVLSERLGQSFRPAQSSNQVQVRAAIQEVLATDPRIQGYLKNSRNLFDTNADIFFKDMKAHKEIALKVRCEGLQQCGQFIAMLGMTTKSKDVERIGYGLQALTMIYQGLAAPTMMALGPIGMIGSGVLTVAALLKKKKKAEADPVMMMFAKHLTFISEQINVVIQGQNIIIGNQRILHSMLSHITDLLGKIREEINDFRVPVMGALRRLEDSNQQIADYMKMGLDTTLLADYDRVTAEAQNLFERAAWGEEIGIDTIRNTHREILRWLRPDQNTHINPALREVNLFENHEAGDFYLRMTQAQRLSLNYFLLFIVKKLGISLEYQSEDQGIVNIDPNGIPNLGLLFESGLLYFDFLQAFPQWVPKIDVRLQHLSSVQQLFERTLLCMRILQKKSYDIFKKLFKEYQDTVAAIQVLAYREIDKVNTEINRMIGELVEKNVAYMPARDTPINQKFIMELKKSFTIDIKDSYFGYDLELMSKLPDRNENLAEIGKIYLSPNSNYVVRGLNGTVQKGKLSPIHGFIDLSNLSQRLNDEALKERILKQTSRAAHTTYLKLGKTTYSTPAVCSNNEMIYWSEDFHHHLRVYCQELFHAWILASRCGLGQLEYSRIQSASEETTTLKFISSGKVDFIKVDCKFTTDTTKSIFGIDRTFRTFREFRAISYSKNLVELTAEVKAKLENYLLEARRKAIRPEILEQVNQHGIKINAILRAMKAIGDGIGMQVAELEHLNLFWDANAISQRFAKFLISSTENLQPIGSQPYLVPIPNEQLFLSKLAPFNEGYFKSNLVPSLNFMNMQFMLQAELLKQTLAQPQVAAPPVSEVKKPGQKDNLSPQPLFKVKELYEKQKVLFEELAFTAEQLSEANFVGNPIYLQAIKHAKMGQNLLKTLESLDQVTLLKSLRTLNGYIKELNRSLGLIRYDGSPVNPGVQDNANRVDRFSAKLKKLQGSQEAQHGFFGKNTDEQKNTSKGSTQHRPNTLPTVADGDCGIHALCGTFDSSKNAYFCSQVSIIRQEVAKVIKECKSNDQVYQHIQSAISDLVMELSDRKNKGLPINVSAAMQHAVEEYIKFKMTDDQQLKTSWDMFLPTLQSANNVMDYIKKETEKSACPDFKINFQSCLNKKDSCLRELIKFDLRLQSAFEKYEKNSNGQFNWNKILENNNRALIHEYADIKIAKKGAYLLPVDLNIIAIVRKITIVYDASNLQTGGQSSQERINPGCKEIVGIRFDGINHYERVDLNLQSEQSNFSKKNPEPINPAHPAGYDSFFNPVNENSSKKHQSQYHDNDSDDDVVCENYSGHKTFKAKS